MTFESVIRRNTEVACSDGQAVPQIRVGAGALTVAVLASSILFALALPPVSLWPFAYVALVPWLFALGRTSRGRGLVSGFVLGTLSGLLISGWVPRALETLGAAAFQAWTGQALVTAWVGGIPFGLLGAVLAGDRPRPPWIQVARVSLAFYLVDLGRSHLPLGVPWGLLGHSQALVPGVAQLATLGGVPLVSALVAATNAALATRIGVPRVWLRQATLLAAFFSGACIALGTAGLPAARWLHDLVPVRAQRPIRLLIVQPNLSPQERWAPWGQRTNLATVASLTEDARAQRSELPDLVVWPETILTTPLEQNPALAADLDAFVNRLGVPLVLGVAREALSGRADRYRNSALWISPGRGVISIVDKTTAIPVVEGVAPPPLDQLFGWALGPAAGGSRVETASRDVSLQGRFSIAVALCYEVVFPGLVERRRATDTAFLLNLANDSWFQGPEVSAQQLAFGAFRAIEQRLYLVRAAHGGVSAVVDPYGQTVSSLHSGTKGALWATVEPGTAPGAREHAGILALPILGGVAAAFLTTLKGRRRE